MTVLRLAPSAGRLRAEALPGIASALAVVDTSVLARLRGAAFAEVPVALVPRLIRALAFAGIAAEPCDADLAPPAGLFVARGMDLSPLPVGLIDLDLVRLRRIPLGLATREVLRRRFAGLLPAGPTARLRCRTLLRGEHVLFAWGRHAWASRAALRSGRARSSLRPVVFDRDAVTRAELDGRTSTRDDDLARWLFG